MTAEEIKSIVEHINEHGYIEGVRVDCKYCPLHERCDELLAQGIAGTIEYVPLCEKVINVALEYTAERYPRVLTLDEALSADDPVYFEMFGRVDFWGDAHLDDSLTHAEITKCFVNTFGDGVLYPLDTYNKMWRCWNCKPYDWQKKEAKWEKGYERD